MKGGLQVISVYKNFIDDPYDTLFKLHRWGYRYLETADWMYPGDLKVSIQDVRSMMDELGFVHMAKHQGSIKPFLNEELQGEIDMMHLLGGKYLVLGSDFYNGYEGVMQHADIYNAIGKKLRGEDLHFVYHCHGHDFQPMNGSTVLELLISHTDPELVSFEVDLMWAFRGGAEPQEFIAKYGDRIRLLHMTDFSKKFLEHRNYFEALPEDFVVTQEFNAVHNIDVSTDIGCGVLDLQAIIDTANQFPNIECGFIETSQNGSMFGRDQMKQAEFGIQQLKLFNGIQFS